MHGLVVALMLNHTVHQYATGYNQARHNVAGSQCMKEMGFHAAACALHKRLQVLGVC